MKRWEEQQRKKNYINRIQHAKPTLQTQAKKPKTPGQRVVYEEPEIYSPDVGYVPYSQPTFQSPMASPAHPISFSSEPSTGSSSQKRQDLLIFQLLRAFKLQQYAQKLSEVGYGQDVYKLALLNDRQRLELIEQLKVLPGHKAKLMSLFDVIDELYPRKLIVEQLKQFTPGNKQQIKNQSRRVFSAAQPTRQPVRVPARLGTAAGMERSLIHQYEALDHQTKQAFNNTFLINLESVKYQIPQLFTQHFQQEDRRAAINYIFPPSAFFQPMTSQQTESSYQDREIQQLVTKYAGRTQATGGGRERQSSSSQNRQQQQLEEQHLKQEMAHAMKVIEKVNRELEQLTNQSQVEYDLIKKNKRKSTSSNYSSKNSNSVSTGAASNSNNGRMDIQSSNQTKRKPQSISSSKTNSVSKPQRQVQQDLGRLQSNRALARERMHKQQLHPRVITEHDVASEFTNTPFKQSNNASGIGLISGLKMQQQTSLTNAIQEIQIRYSEENEEEDSEEKEEDSGVQTVIEHNTTDPGILMEVEQPEPIQKIDPTEEVSPIKPVSKQPLIGPSRQRKLSPLLERVERDLLWNNAFGHSFDSKQVASALGFLDLKQICLCLAHALDRHIQFSQGFYFLDDLQEQIKLLKLEDHLKLDFSYEIDSKLKIELPTSKPKESSQQNKKEFEELKEIIAKPKKAVFEYKEPSPIEDGQFDRDDEAIPDFAEDDPQYIQDFYGNERESVRVKEVEDEEPLDLDYSYSHLEDFLKSHKKLTSGPSSIANAQQQMPPGSINKNATATTTQQLMNTFLTSYNKNRALSSARKAEPSNQEVIVERRAEESGSSNGLVKLPPASTLSSQKSDNLQIDVRTKEGFKDLIRFQMRIFDCNYDFEEDRLGDAPPADENPTIEELYYFCKYVIVSGRMEKEIPILCLVYIERFLTKTGILLNHLNWRRLTLISLCLASKIWDDDSLENVHFPKVMPDVSLKEIASLEKVFLQFLDFDLLLRGAEYAKYYFVLKTIANELDTGGMNSCLPPVGPLTSQKMAELQNNTAKVESELRDKYEIKLSLQRTM